MAMPELRMLHPPRTSGSSIRVSWELRPPEYLGHDDPTPARFSYGFTRNPWDRAVSLYHLFAREESFTAWVAAGMPHHDVRPLTNPTVYWLDGADWVGHFERRDDDLAELCSILGRPTPTKHIAASQKRRPYPEYYDDETVQLVAALYEPDIHRFGYAFGDP